MKIVAKPKPKHIKDGDVKEVRIAKAENGGADVHVRHAPSKGNEFPIEKHTGSFSTIEEAFHHAAGHMGANVQMDDDDANPDAEPQGQEVVEEPAGDGKQKKAYPKKKEPAAEPKV